MQCQFISMNHTTYCRFYTSHYQNRYYIDQQQCIDTITIIYTLILFLLRYDSSSKKQRQANSIFFAFQAPSSELTMEIVNVIISLSQLNRKLNVLQHQSDTEILLSLKTINLLIAARQCTSSQPCFLTPTNLPFLLLLDMTSQQQRDNLNQGASPRRSKYLQMFPRSFIASYGQALGKLTDDKILSRLHDWNCKWLKRQRVAISKSPRR